MKEFVELSNLLADEAGKMIKRYYRQPFEIETKSDDSPVTIADRAVEKRMREILEAERPDDGIFGEEYGIKESRNGLMWVLDPIDGTKSFMMGRPSFGTLIALCEEDVPKLGVIDQPITNERWIGVSRQETMFNGTRVKTRSCFALSEAIICSTTPSMFKGMPAYYERFYDGKMAHGLIWGGDCYMYGLLASGYLDMTIEASLSPYDFAALVPVVEGAGGVICDYQGQSLSLQSDGNVIALGDKHLLQSVLEKLTD